MQPQNRFQRWRRGIFITVGALVISTLGIQASDLSQGVVGNLAGVVFTSEEGPCAAHETLLRYGTYALCVDTYEVSPGPGCPRVKTESVVHTTDNVGTVSCKPLTAPGVEPWRFVTYTQAQQLCARANKRLPTAEEWHRIAVGQADTAACVLKSAGPAPTGSAECTTAGGVHDMVGNVWEWVNDTVTDGQFAGRQLPGSGYVQLVDEQGIVVETGEAANAAFGDDYAWVQSESVRGILRGGFYGSGNDGGVFAQNVAVPLDFATAGVGFRCVRDV